MMPIAHARRLVFTALAVLTPAISHAQWNLSNDFSTAVNPNGAWTFGSRAFGNLASTGLTVYTNSGSSLGWDFEWTAAGGLPGVYKNTTNVPQTSGTVNYGPGQVNLHPGSAGDYSIVRWTAPSAGTYALASLFTGLDCCATTSDVNILVNGGSIFSAFVNGFGSTQSYSSNLFLGAGDLVDVAVGFGANNNYYYDSTGLNLTIDAVNVTPEPASFVLFVTGLLAVGGVVRRRRAS